MKELCVALGIERRLSTAYHPRCEGTPESHVKKVKHHLKRLTGNEIDRWSDFVPAAQMAVNLTINRRHKSSPHSLFFNRPPTGFDNFAQAESRLETVEELIARNDEYYHTVVPAMRKITDEYNKEMKRYHDAKNNINADKLFVPGTTVRVWNEPKRLWEGPCRIVRKNRGGAYEVVYSDTNETYHRNVAPSQMRLIAKAGDDLLEDGDHEANHFAVDRVVDHAQDAASGVYKYRVRWEGYSEYEDTWEFADAFETPKPIQLYWRSLGKTPDAADQESDDQAFERVLEATNSSEDEYALSPSNSAKRRKTVQSSDDNNAVVNVTPVSGGDGQVAGDDQDMTTSREPLVGQTDQPVLRTRSGRRVRFTLGDDFVQTS